MSYRWQQTRKFTFSSYSRSGIFRFCADYLWAQAFVFNSFLIFCKVDASLSEKRWFRGCFDALNPPNRGIPNFVSHHNQANDKFTADSEAFDDFEWISYRINTEINVKVYNAINLMEILLRTWYRCLSQIWVVTLSFRREIERSGAEFLKNREL